MRRILPFALPLLLVPAPLYAAPAAPIAGRWLTEDRDAIITIGACGGATCGRITRILKPAPGGNSTDRNNPDPKLRTRPIEGLAVLSGFSDAGKDWRGRIYDPKSGKSYKSIVLREADGRLKVQGCIAFLCRTQRWTPAR